MIQQEFFEANRSTDFSPENAFLLGEFESVKAVISFFQSAVNVQLD